MSWYIGPSVLALVSGVFHAGWNTLAKRMGATRGATIAILTADLLIMALVYPMLAHTMTWRALPWMLLAAIGEAGYVTALGIALSKGDLGVTYGVSRSLALLVVWPAGFLVFGDVPSVAAWVATAFLCVGMFLCQPRASDSATSKMSFAWTAATGLCVGIYHTAYKGAVHAGADAVTTFAGSILFAVPLLWIFSPSEIRREAVRVARSFPRMTVAAGIMSAASFVLAVLALSVTQSGRVLGLRNASIGFAALFAYFGGERPSRRQWVGLGVLFAGVAVLVFA